MYTFGEVKITFSLNAVKMYPAMTEKMTRWLSTQDFSDYLKRIQRVLMIQ